MPEKTEKPNQNTGPAWPPGYIYELAPGAGDHSDCFRCAFYSLPGCGQLHGGCGERGFWRVKVRI